MRATLSLLSFVAKRKIGSRCGSGRSASLNKINLAKKGRKMSEQNYDGEIWKAIPGFEGKYEVSNLGRVKSLPKFGRRERILNSKPNDQGYKTVCLKRKAVKVHRLVSNAFIPNPYNKPEVNHKNGIKTQNDVLNLEWVTRFENQRHSFLELGRRALRGIQSGMAKLNDRKVVEIRGLVKSGFASREIGKLFGVTHRTVLLVAKKKIWAHVPD
jgi:hypothetical protein